MRCDRCGAVLPSGSERCAHCGSAPTLELPTTGSDPPPRPGPPSRLLAPDTLVAGTYVVHSVIAEGGMGVVYRATDTALGRPVALKTLHLNLLGNAEIRRRFLREGQLLRRWTHPNVGVVHDVIDEPDVLGLVMELIEGPTLTEEIRRWRGRFPISELRPVLQGVLAGLGAAHARGIVHRDLKPGNILLDRSTGQTVGKVIDFGIAKVLEGTTYTVTGALLGTCRYMSPEQVRAPTEVGPWSDLYALGVTLFEALSGRPPFDDDNHFTVMMAHVTQVAPSLAELRPDVPPELVAIVERCLAKDPAERPESAEALWCELDAVLPRPAVTPERALPRRRDHRHGRLTLVPSGPFSMGHDRRRVTLPAYYLDHTPVTNAQFHRFVTATGYRPEDAGVGRFVSHWVAGRPVPGSEDHPVTYVAHDDARAYAAWAGLRLPTEAEWEKAARGPQGRRYPWGRQPPDDALATFARHTRGVRPVTSCPDGAGPYGHLDLAGNVWEWCSDRDDPEFYTDGPVRSPWAGAPRVEDRAVVRGGAWGFDAQALRTTSRTSFSPTDRSDSVGFRCASDP